MKRERKTFQRDGYTLVVDTISGERVVYRVRDGEELPTPTTKRAKSQSPKEPTTNRTDCAHIIEPTGDSVLQENCGCPGNKMTSVWNCELFGRVAPFAKGDPVDGVRACQKCGAYRKALLPAPPGE